MTTQIRADMLSGSAGSGSRYIVRHGECGHTTKRMNDSDCLMFDSPEASNKSTHCGPCINDTMRHEATAYSYKSNGCDPILTTAKARSL